MKTLIAIVGLFAIMAFIPIEFTGDGPQDKPDIEASDGFNYDIASYQPVVAPVFCQSSIPIIASMFMLSEKGEKAKNENFFTNYPVPYKFNAQNDILRSQIATNYKARELN